MLYRPDSSEMNPNILVSVKQLIANTDGSYRVPFPAVATAYAALTGTATNAFFAEKPDATARLIVATLTKRYEADGVSAWTDISAGGGSYASSPRTSLCQFGTATIACNLANPTEYSESGAFLALSSAPRAMVCASGSNAVLLANVIVNGESIPDGISISDQDNIEQWVPATDLSNLSYQTRLTDVGGDITAAIKVGDVFVIFKRRGMWTAQFVGAPQIWDVRLRSANVGCLGQDACIVAEDRLYWADDQNAYEFDGATIRSISDDKLATKTILASMRTVQSGDAKYTELHYDDVGKVLSAYVQFNSSGYRNKYWSFNTSSREWGYAEISALSGDIPHELCSVRAPIKKLIDFGGLSITAASKENRLAFVLASGAASSTLQSGHGMAAVAGTAVTAYFGDATAAGFMNRLYLDADDPTGVSVSVTAKRAPTGSATTQSTATGSVSADLIADVLCQGHFFKITYTFAAATAVFARWMAHTPIFANTRGRN